ncbi:TPR repeat-containing protein [Richelia sinica FACHB-800]|uniref:TPR repeat-containing protein n=1 Tax=Richelia sinica FACHB-800 TaxID=1357546 RepID=A0A975Y4W5_9NOST|nr:tetratricopeptide repeat protein [Richelia sinica]MBD2665793.1 tetratricopeptide repeat protein [Richelia sinica FACHB-800]QXE23610.1 TPR repeat-containing protein [Richelia sinica FACHB-800]
MQVLRCLAQPELLNLSASLGRGGEACIYALATDENLVAKIYHQPTNTHIQKLLAMLANPPENPTANLGHISIAWPQELLKAADGSDSVIGFLMPRIRGMRPIMDFYHPATRRQHCPLFSYKYLLRTARNLATAFAALHASQYYIGDVNESNILVSDTALITLVDTDSFQVFDPENDVVYRCPVGKPEFTPPELQNRVFAEYDRQSHHDLFGLAVLIFQLLMEGTHPFAGIFQGKTEPPPYEARISAGHFTYSRKHPVPYLPAPSAPPWEILHPSLQDLFIQCFEDGHDNPKFRPSAQTWFAALVEAEENLVTCGVNSQHRYGNHLDTCPWCERTVRLGGRDPFPSRQAIASGEHLKPRRKPKRQHYPQHTWFPQTGIASPIYHWQPIFSTNNFPVKPTRKLKSYGVIAGLLGFGFLGYLDVMIKFTRPFVSQNPYTQQSILTNNAAINPAPTVNVNFGELYQQGDTAYRKRDYEGAVKNFSYAIQKNPTHAKTYINRGNARYNLNDYEGALVDYTEAIKINPQEVKAYVNRGNAYYRLADYSSDPDKEYRKALADFNQAIKLNNKDAEAYIRRGIVRFQMAKYSNNSTQEYEKAIADFSQSITLNVSKSEAYYQRGLVRYHVAQYSSNYVSEYKKAIADFDQAITISPHQAKVYLKRGMVHYELSQYGENQSPQYKIRAIEDLQTAAKLSLEQEDMDNYQQALSNICVVVVNKCDSLFEEQTILGKKQ